MLNISIYTHRTGIVWMLLASILAQACFAAEVSKKSESRTVAGTPQKPAASIPNFQAGDMVGFIGGADVAGAQFTGHLESLLTFSFQNLGLRFRNFGWEGDTVFEQPRDIGFPPLPVHLKKSKTTVLLVQFGRIESLAGPQAFKSFLNAYTNFLNSIRPQARLIILVTPPPFEKSTPPLPDLSLRNKDLALYSEGIRTIADENQLPVIDLFSSLKNDSSKEILTVDGMQLSAFGQGRVGEIIFSHLHGRGKSQTPGRLNQTGSWPEADWEKLRRGIIAKNRLWFDYWRPQNWAFLGGDRTTQPSSRDHRDRSKRWFPEEMEKFPPLIAEHEKETARQAELMLKKTR